MTRFLCIYLSCQSNNFKFANSTLCQALDCSEDTLRKYMKEAIDLGLIEREQRIDNGKFGYYEYTLNNPDTLILPARKKTVSENFRTGKTPTLNKEEVFTKVNTLTKEECANEIGEQNPVAVDAKKSKSKELEEKAKKTLEFFNEHTGKCLTSSVYVDAIKKAIREGFTGEDLAFATFEQEYDTRENNDARSKFLTPQTVFRKSNLARLSDRFRGRSKEDQLKIIQSSPRYTSKSSQHSVPWREWPTPKGWQKDITSAGYYSHQHSGRMHYSEMVEQRMAKADFFPNALQSVA
jgi:hypothetical protein